MDTKKLKADIESILFTMGESVEIPVIAKALEIKSADVRKIVKELQDEYAKDGRGLKIIELDNIKCAQSQRLMNL